MPLNLRLAVLIIALILAVVVIRILHKRMIPVKYSLLWGIGVIILLFLAIWPNSLIVLANLVGFQTVSNMVIGVLLVILFFITNIRVGKEYAISPTIMAVKTCQNLR